jgi:hypothetical protein
MSPTMLLPSWLARWSGWSVVRSQSRSCASTELAPVKNLPSGPNDSFEIEPVSSDRINLPLPRYRIPGMIRDPLAIRGEVHHGAVANWPIMPGVTAEDGHETFGLPGKEFRRRNVGGLEFIKRCFLGRVFLLGRCVARPANRCQRQDSQPAMTGSQQCTCLS